MANFVTLFALASAHASVEATSLVNISSDARDRINGVNKIEPKVLDKNSRNRKKIIITN